MSPQMRIVLISHQTLTENKCARVEICGNSHYRADRTDIRLVFSGYWTNPLKQEKRVYSALASAVSAKPNHFWQWEGSITAKPDKFIACQLNCKTSILQMNVTDFKFIDCIILSWKAYLISLFNQTTTC